MYSYMQEMVRVRQGEFKQQLYWGGQTDTYFLFYIAELTICLSENSAQYYLPWKFGHHIYLRDVYVIPTFGFFSYFEAAGGGRDSPTRRWLKFIK